jgi:hypothetical protein
MDTVEIQATEKAQKSFQLPVLYNLAQHAMNKFKGERAGLFNRYLTADRHGEAERILVVFETNNKALVMLYSEALAIPTLAAKCKEKWGDE